MKRRYVTADVFTSEQLKGNQLAVVLDAEGLSTAQMQAVAAEFAYSETTFVLPPRDQANTAQVRIFTRSREVPFAGHPNIGTAYVLATGDLAAQEGDQPKPFIFEELAGLVPVRQLMDGSTVVGAELITPEPLSEASELSAAHVAECLSLTENDILVTAHPPKVVSVGLPFLVAEVASRSALAKCIPNLNAYKRFLPLDGATSIYVYTRDVAGDPTETHTDIQARMFTPHMTEDPATGSATAAMAAFFARVHARPTLSLTVGQGFDMGRASLLYVNIDTQGEQTQIRVGGNCIRMMEGTFELAGEA